MLYLWLFYIDFHHSWEKGNATVTIFQMLIETWQKRGPIYKQDLLSTWQSPALWHDVWRHPDNWDGHRLL